MTPDLTPSSMNPKSSAMSLKNRNMSQPDAMARGT